MSGKNSGWEEKIFFKCFAFSRKAFAFPRETLRSLAKLLRSLVNIYFFKFCEGTQISKTIKVKLLNFLLSDF